MSTGDDMAALSGDETQPQVGGELGSSCALGFAIAPRGPAIRSRIRRRLAPGTCCCGWPAPGRIWPRLAGCTPICRPKGRWRRVAQVVPRGAAWAGLAIVGWRLWRKAPWPIEPGLWLAAAVGLWLLATAVLATPTAAEHFQGPRAVQAALACVIFVLPALRRDLARPWKWFFMFLVALFALPLVIGLSTDVQVAQRGGLTRGVSYCSRRATIWPRRRWRPSWSTTRCAASATAGCTGRALSSSCWLWRRPGC